MKKFNPDKELENLKSKRIKGDNSKLGNMYVPLLVVACSCLAMSAVAFSAKLADETQNKYTVRIDIVNGNQDVFIKNVKEGSFSATINGNGSFESFDCTNGSLEYDPITSIVSSEYVNENTTCELVFSDDEQGNELAPNGLNSINDNMGKSYYYKADATNNYIRINDRMFRIVRINGDGSYRVILDDVITKSSYGLVNEYSGSTIAVLLQEWFNNTFGEENNFVEADYDGTNYVDYEVENLINFEGYSLRKVGTLSVREASIISDGVTGENYLNVDGGFYLANGNGTDNVFAYRDGSIQSVNPSEEMGVRPVINVNGPLNGEGTLENPYTLS